VTAGMARDAIENSLAIFQILNVTT